MTLLIVAFGFLAGALTAVRKHRWVSRETSIANRELAATLEAFLEAPWDELVARYDGDPWNDPLGPATAVGMSFDLVGLQALSNDPDGLVGEVRLPLVDVAAPGDTPRFELREDVVDPALGMPRDLNGDSVIDDADHSADFVILPVIVRAAWSGVAGPRSFELAHIHARIRR